MTLIFKNFVKYKKKIALMDTNTSISYEDLLKTSELLEKKIHQNSVSLLIAENNIDFVKGYVGF